MCVCIQTEKLKNLGLVVLYAAFDEMVYSKKKILLILCIRQHFDGSIVVVIDFFPLISVLYVCVFCLLLSDYYYFKGGLFDCVYARQLLVFFSLALEIEKWNVFWAFLYMCMSHLSMCDVDNSHQRDLLLVSTFVFFSLWLLLLMLPLLNTKPTNNEIEFKWDCCVFYVCILAGVDCFIFN